MRTDPASTLLAVIDIQERLAAVVPDCERLIQRTVRLARAAEILGVRRALTEQYPKGLGPTVPDLLGCMPAAEEKLAFSAAGCGCLAVAPAAGVKSVVLAGLETHICILQTALELLERGVSVFVAVDAVGSRYAIDHETALRRLEMAGVVPVTTESVLFEWCRGADHACFREIRNLVIAG